MPAPISIQSAPRRSQVQRRREAEQRIIQAAVGIIAERGLNGLTLAAAGERAGYSRGIAGHHFGKKDALLTAIVQYIMDRFSDYVAADPKSEPGFDMLAAMINRYLDDIKRDASRIRAFLLIMTEGMNNPALAPAIARANERAVRGVEANIRRGMEQGEIRGDIDPRAQAVILLSGLRGVMAQWLVDADQVPLRAVRREFIESLKRSLAP